MSFSIDIHTDGKLRVSHFMPDNNNSLTLKTEGGSVALFGLPDDTALALFELLCDERSVLVKGLNRFRPSDAGFDDALDALRASGARQIFKGAA